MNTSVADAGGGVGFPRQYYQAYRHNYISDDCQLLVFGPDWSRVRKVGGKSSHLISIVKKIDGRFNDVETVWCTVVDSGGCGNCAVRSIDEKIMLDDYSFWVFR